MSDVFIGIFYFLATLGVALFGACLLFKPQRFYPLISRPLFGRTSMAQGRDSAESDVNSGRKLGVIMLISGAFMFIMPLVIAVKNPGNDSISPVSPPTHYSQPESWGSYFVWFLFLCVGCFLAIRPLPILNYFRSKRAQPAIPSGANLIGPRVVGVVIILVALFGLIQVVRH